MAENKSAFGESVALPVLTEIMTSIAVKTVSGTGASVDCALAWKEDK